MFLNNSSPEQPPKPLPQNPSPSPNYGELVQFLFKPFLESPESLRVDCEYFSGQRRTWIRLAFEAEDKGRVYGRGGRNIQAIRTVLSAIAQSAGESVYLDIYEDESETPLRTTSSRSSDKRPTRSRTPHPSGTSTRPRVPRRHDRSGA